MAGLSSGPDDNFDSEELEVSAIIQQWIEIGIIDFPSRTLRNDFSAVLAQLQKTDIHIRALEEVFRALMEIHFQDGLDSGCLKTMPKDVFAVLRGEEQLELNALKKDDLVVLQGDEKLELDVPKGFFVDLVEQMKIYYSQFLEWKGV